MHSSSLFSANNPEEDIELFIEALGSVRFAKSRWLKCLPMLPYYAYRRQSRRHHYLTRDGSDPNIRQVVVKFVKVAHIKVKMM